MAYSNYGVPYRSYPAPYTSLGSVLPVIIGMTMGMVPGGGAPFPVSVSPLLWFDGSQSAWSDLARTVPAVAPFGQVRSIAQHPQLAGFWTAPSDAERPTKLANGCSIEPLANDFPIHNGQELLSPAFVSPVQINNYSMAISFRPYTSYGALPQSLAWDGVTGLAQSGNQIVAYYNGATAWNTGITIGNVGGDISGNSGAGDEVIVILTVLSTGLLIYVNDNGTISTASMSASVTSGVMGQIAIGGNNGQGFGDSVVGQMIVSLPVTTDERTKIAAYLIGSGVSDAFPLDQGFIGVIGDSIPQGTGTNTPGSWPSRMLSYLQANFPGNRLLNAAVSGSGVPPITGPNSSMFTTIASHITPARANNVVIVSVGTNTIVSDPSSGGVIAAVNQLWVLCDALRAKGAKVAVSTVLPRSGNLGSTTQTQFNTAAAQWNALIASQGPTHTDYQIDLSNVPSMGLQGTGSGTGSSAGVYYNSDQVHPTYYGHCLLTPSYLNAVLTLIGHPPAAFTGDFAALALSYGLSDVVNNFRSDLGVAGTQGSGKATWANQFGAGGNMTSDAADGIGSVGTGLNGKASVIGNGTSQGGKFITASLGAPASGNQLHRWGVQRIITAAASGAVFGDISGTFTCREIGASADIQQTNGSAGATATPISAGTWYAMRASFTGSANDQVRIGKHAPAFTACGASVPNTNLTLFYASAVLSNSEALSHMVMRGPISNFLSFDAEASRLAQTFWTNAIEI